MRVTIVNPVWDRTISTPELLLDRFTTLTGWAESLPAAAVSQVTVVQRFSRDASFARAGVTYRFCDDGGTAQPPLWHRGSTNLHDAVRQSAPDLVHVNGLLHPELLCRLRATLPPAAAIVAQDHGGFDPRPARWLLRRWLRRGLTSTDAVFVSAPGLGDLWRESGVLPARMSIHDVMESSTRLQPIPRDTARSQSRLEGSPALLSVGRLTSGKDPITLLRGVARFFERHPRGHLTLVYQDATLEPEVRRTIAELPPLESRVTLAGHVPHDELPAYFSAADLFVSASRAEGSGYAAIEAMACGATPVLTDIPSFRSLSGDDTIGALWRAGDPASLDAALERAWAAWRTGTAPNTANWFDERFSWPAIGYQASAAYADVLRARRARPRTRA